MRAGMVVVAGLAVVWLALVAADLLLRLARGRAARAFDLAELSLLLALVAVFLADPPAAAVVTGGAVVGASLLTQLGLDAAAGSGGRSDLPRLAVEVVKIAALAATGVAALGRIP
ncbi:hypothetical protein SAMN05443637_111158 [Pseudonocardia thermophila]|uniref:Uncharacterized protein n=1 Tax=Pseudonocardia thermophila TaxID=1848 RepID=A0A1M6V2J4_PSETH|nr:hypothetical protein [Pseudonocardia thermophila]SHK75673.1 hypothetical protein SAMN05443637_111158 [Pseudonocardia thermophila]